MSKFWSSLKRSTFCISDDPVHVDDEQVAKDTILSHLRCTRKPVAQLSRYSYISVAGVRVSNIVRQLTTDPVVLHDSIQFFPVDMIESLFLV